MNRTCFIALAVVISASIAVAQSPKDQASVFSVKGTVVDGKGNPVGYALLYLKDASSRLLRMKRAGRDGHFTFTFLRSQLDYAIYAERDNLVSEKVIIAGSQKAPEVVITLRLNRDIGQQ